MAFTSISSQRAPRASWLRVAVRIAKARHDFRDGAGGGDQLLIQVRHRVVFHRRVVHDRPQLARVRQQFVEVVPPSCRQLARWPVPADLRPPEHFANPPPNPVHGGRSALPLRLDHLEHHGDVDIGHRDAVERPAIGRHAVAPLGEVLRPPAIAVAFEKPVEALLEGCGVQFGGADRHALGIAVGERIAAGRQQLPGHVGLRPRFGERDHPSRAEPHDAFTVIDLVAEQPRLGDDALGRRGVRL